MIKITYILQLILLIAITGCSTVVHFSQAETPYQPPQRVWPEGSIKWALVLGAGGTKGLAHIGVIEELEKAGLRPDLIVGSSAGAIVGALYADQHDIQYVKKVLLETEREHIVSYSPSLFGLLNIAKCKAFLRKTLRSQNFADLKIPYVNIATNLEFGTMTLFSKGPLLPSLLASVAVPGAFRPYKIAGQLFVDGAVTNPVPVSVAKQLGAEYVVAVDVSELLTKSAPRHLFGVMKRSNEISYRYQVDAAVRDADIVVRFDFRDLGIFTFTSEHNMKLYQAGRRAGQKAVLQLQKLLRQDKKPMLSYAKPHHIAVLVSQ